MDKKEFTKLFKELQKIQLSLLYSTKLSSDLYTNCNLNNTSYIKLMKHIVTIFIAMIVLIRIELL